VTSGRIDDDERQELVALGVSAIVQKPFTVEQLIAALAEAGIRSSDSG
jgi:CheY-like chemotaxis protein